MTVILFKIFQKIPIVQYSKARLSNAITLIYFGYLEQQKS